MSASIEKDTVTGHAMITELGQLEGDLHDVFEAVIQQGGSWLSLPENGQILLTGCGDSLSAAYCMAPAFAELAGRMARVVLPREVASLVGPSTLTVGISASGSTPAVLSALEAARKLGGATLLLTGQEHSTGSDIAEDTLLLPLRNKQRGPGVRTYQANLVGLLGMALQLGRQRRTTCNLEQWRAHLHACGDAVAMTTQNALNALENWPVLLQPTGAPMHVLSDRALRPTAEFICGKRFEASGCHAAAMDMEEFWHVGRFALPQDAPVVVLYAIDAEVESLRAARIARAIGRTLITCGPTSAFAFHDHALCAIHISDTPHTLLRCITTHIPGTAFAAKEALMLERLPFRADLPGLFSQSKYH